MLAGLADFAEFFAARAGGLVFHGRRRSSPVKCTAKSRVRNNAEAKDVEKEEEEGVSNAPEAVNEDAPPQAG